MTRQEQLNSEMFTALNEEANNKPFLNTEMGQYAYQLGFEKGAEIDRKIMIDKVCEWLKFHVSIPCEIETTDVSAKDYLDWAKKRLEAVEEICNDFREAMEEL